MTDRTPAYYAPIQYCPCFKRAESLNVGVLLYREEPYFLKVDFNDNLEHVWDAFFVPSLSAARVVEAMKHLKTRMELERFTLAGLKEFAATRADCLQIVQPRCIVSANLNETFEQLFLEIA